MSDALWIKSYPKNTDWNLHIPEKTMVEALDDVASKYGSRPAITCLGKTYDWASIREQVERLSAALQHKGVGKGVKVGLFLPNSSFFLIAYYAVLKCGATAVNFNPLYAPREVKYQIEDSQCDVFITADLEALFPKAYQMLDETRLQNIILFRFADMLPFPKNHLFPVLRAKDCAQVPEDERILWAHDLMKSAPEFKPVAIDPENDIALLQYTGGTTGVPKGAMLSHKNIYANTYQSVSWFPNVRHGQDRMMGVLPFFHVFAMTTIMNFSVMAGLHIITMPRFDLEETLKLIDKYKPHFFPAVPAIYNGMNNSTKREKYDLTSLKYCISGGAPLPVEVKKQFETLTGCIVIEGYGLSESSPVAVANPIEGENVAGSIGLPLPQTVIEIIDPETKKPVKLGERGEVCIKGPQVMKGYWNNKEATAKTIIDGRLHTGDIGIMDEKGYVYIVDRLKDMIITNGYNVYPRNVEEGIYLHEAVEECIVAGLPDKQRGEIVKAWVKLKDGYELSEKELRAFLKEQISPMEMPRRIEFRAEPLPKTMIGKLSRKDIVEQELEG